MITMTTNNQQDDDNDERSPLHPTDQWLKTHMSWAIGIFFFPSSSFAVLRLNNCLWLNYIYGIHNNNEWLPPAHLCVNMPQLPHFQQYPPFWCMDKWGSRCICISSLGMFFLILFLLYTKYFYIISYVYRLQQWTANNNTINQHHQAYNHGNPATTTSRTDKCDLRRIWCVSSSGKFFFFIFLLIFSYLDSMYSKHHPKWARNMFWCISSPCKLFFYIFLSFFCIDIIYGHQYEHPTATRNTNKVLHHHNGRSLRHLHLESWVWWAQVSFDFHFFFTLPSAFYL